jgi:hypothetical protein
LISFAIRFEGQIKNSTFFAYLDGITYSITFTPMALIVKSTKLPQEVIDKINEDVVNKKFKSANNAIINILAKYYKLKRVNYA